MQVRLVPHAILPEASLAEVQDLLGRTAALDGEGRAGEDCVAAAETFA